VCAQFDTENKVITKNFWLWG